MFHASAFAGKRWNRAQQYPVRYRIHIPNIVFDLYTEPQDQILQRVAFPLLSNESRGFLFHYGGFNEQSFFL